MFTDIVKASWIETLPEKIKPYVYLMRLDRPVGYWLLFWPSAWGLVLAASTEPIPMPALISLLALFFIGAVIMRGSGCIINDLWDKDLDARVERTAERPLPSGSVSSRNALIFLGLLLVCGLLILVQLPLASVLIGFCVVPLIILYPLMKRFTFWPQLFLGVTFNAGALIGWAAVTGEAAISAVCLYLAGLFWTLGYDSIYAYQDKEDDIKAGIKSTAFVFHDRPKPFLALFYSLSIALILSAVSFADGALWTKFLFVPVAVHFFWQVRFWDHRNVKSSLKMFKSNCYAGLLIFLALCSTLI